MSLNHFNIDDVEFGPIVTTPCRHEERTLDDRCAHCSRTDDGEIERAREILDSRWRPGGLTVREILEQRDRSTEPE